MEARLAIDNDANPADFLLSVQQVVSCLSALPPARLLTCPQSG